MLIRLETQKYNIAAYSAKFK